VLALWAASARGGEYGSPLRQTYYVDDPANSVCSGSGRHCSIIECADVRTGAGCMCQLVFPNGARQPLSREQCRAASEELPHLPATHFQTLSVVQPNAECRWHSKEGTSPTECRYRCAEALSVAKFKLPSGTVNCPGEDGAVLQWGQIQGVVTDPAGSADKRTTPVKVPAPAIEPAKEAAGKDKDKCGSCACFYRGFGPDFPGQRATRKDCKDYCTNTKHGRRPADGMKCTGDKAIEWWN